MPQQVIEQLQRALYDVFHVEARYDPRANQLTLRVAVSDGTASALANVTTNRDNGPSDGHPPNRANGPVSGGICWEPPAGPATQPPHRFPCRGARLTIEEAINLNALP